MRVKIAKGWKDEVRWAATTRPPKNSEGHVSPERLYRVHTGPSKADLRREGELLVAAHKAEQAALIAAMKLAAKPQHIALRSHERSS